MKESVTETKSAPPSVAFIPQPPQPPHDESAIMRESYIAVDNIAKETMTALGMGSNGEPMRTLPDVARALMAKLQEQDGLNEIALNTKVALQMTPQDGPIRNIPGIAAARMSELIGLRKEKAAWLKKK